MVDEAYAFLRAHTRGDLRFDEHLRAIRYVIEPGGRLVAPVMVAMLSTFDCVLFVPEASEGALELQISMQTFDESDDTIEGCALSGGALADRWRIHHGDPPDVRWALLDIDAAKLAGHVIDGEAFLRPNPLTADEPGLCRRMNKERPDDVRNLLVHFGKIKVDAPIMVAIDPFGLDVRGQFEVYRVPAVEPMTTIADAERVLESMCLGARTALRDEQAS